MRRELGMKPVKDGVLAEILAVSDRLHEWSEMHQNLAGEDLVSRHVGSPVCVLDVVGHASAIEVSSEDRFTLNVHAVQHAENDGWKTGEGARCLRPREGGGWGQQGSDGGVLLPMQQARRAGYPPTTASERTPERTGNALTAVELCRHAEPPSMEGPQATADGPATRAIRGRR